MTEPRTLPLSTLSTLPPADAAAAKRLAGEGLASFSKKTVVLDDDPTGIQTVHDVYVYTDWSRETLLRAFQDEGSMFFILTNSRGMTSDESRHLHEEIACSIAAASRETGQDFVLVSRSDSTLRGHYPLETEVLREELEAQTDMRFDGEIICPFFEEGGRFTIGNIHYVREGDKLVPAGLTEFAKDKTFGYTSSSLPEWCQEKTGGGCNARDILCVSIEELRRCDVDRITERLMSVEGFGKVVVNAACNADIEVFIAAFCGAVSQGKRFMFRSAAAIPKALGGVEDRPLLSRAELGCRGGSHGGLIIAGSHVNRTTRQLEELKAGCPELTYIVFDQHKALVQGGLEMETKRVSELASDAIARGTTAVVYTRRDRLDIKGAGPEEQLRMSLRISEAVTDVVALLNTEPRFILAKGGITSSDVGTKALRVRRAKVMGQVLPGVPVWLTDADSRFPGMPYVIFPGNVGDEMALLNAARVLI